MAVDLDPELIQPRDGRLRLLRLSDPAPGGTDLALESVRRLTPDAEVRDAGDGQGIYAGETLIGFLDPRRNETSLFPRLDLLSPDGDLRNRTREAVADLARRPELIPDDGSDRVIEDPLVLRGNQGSRRRITEPADYLGFARVRREWDRVPVVGPGSRASVLVSGDGIEGLSHTWRAAETVEEFAGDDVDRERVAEDIRRGLEPLAVDQDVVVDAVELVYYDGDRDVIQPAYRYYASYGGDDQFRGHLVGHVPFREGWEDLPPVIVSDQLRPIDPEIFRSPGGGRSPRIGRYVVRKDDAGWVTSANSFLSGLQFGGSFSGLSPIDAQYFWAEPRLFTDENHDFVDAVEVALTEVHGDWGVFSTLQNNADIVSLSGVPTDGYGGAIGQGALAYWILHSCEVIPTLVDTSSSYDVWWNIFNGLRAALGYRTEMFINDQITFAFGFRAALGAPMVSSWLSTVINDDSYATHPTYKDPHGRGQQPWGRPSAVNVLGHADDTIFQTGGLGRPSVLQQWWFDS